MLNRTTVLALAAITALGAASLAPVTAAAKAPAGKVATIKHFHHKHHHHRHVRWWWPRRFVKVVTVATPVAVGGSVAYAAGPSMGSCSCLTKEYLADGRVLFKDLCTKESAMSAASQ